MEIEYEITTDDLYAFQLRAVRRSPQVRRASRNTYIYYFLALLLFSMLPSIDADGFDITRMNFTFLLVAFPIIALSHRYFDRRRTRRIIREAVGDEKPDRGQLGRHKIVLNEVGIAESTVVGESKTSWAGVDRVEHDNEYVYIYTSPLGAHVIPKRAFANAQVADSFYQLARISKEAAA